MRFPSQGVNVAGFFLFFPTMSRELAFSAQIETQLPEKHRPALKEEQKHPLENDKT